MTESLALRHVLLIHRHGDRSPITTYVAPRLFMDDAEKEYWVSQLLTPEQLKKLEAVVEMVSDVEPKKGGSWPNGQLTQRGMDGMIQRGRLLRERYRDFLEGVNCDDIAIYSTNILRTIQTAQCVVTGMLPDVGVMKVHTRAPHLLTPIHSHHEYEAFGLYANQVARTNRKGYEKLEKQMKEILELESDQHIHWTMVREVLICRKAHGLPMPEGITDELYDAICGHNAWEWHLLYNDPTKGQRGFVRGLAVIQSHFRKIVEKNTSQRMTIISAHDNTIVALICALGLESGFIIPDYEGITLFLVFVNKLSIIRMTMEGRGSSWRESSKSYSYSSRDSRRSSSPRHHYSRGHSRDRSDRDGYDRRDRYASDNYKDGGRRSSRERNRGNDDRYHSRDDARSHDTNWEDRRRYENKERSYREDSRRDYRHDNSSSRRYDDQSSSRQYHQERSRDSNLGRKENTKEYDNYDANTRHSSDKRQSNHEEYRTPPRQASRDVNNSSRSHGDHNQHQNEHSDERRGQSIQKEAYEYDQETLRRNATTKHTQEERETHDNHRRASRGEKSTTEVSTTRDSEEMKDNKENEDNRPQKMPLPAYMQRYTESNDAYWKKRYESIRFDIKWMVWQAESDISNFMAEFAAQELTNIGQRIQAHEHRLAQWEKNEATELETKSNE
ncbi:histidine acid phosphatase [Thraustotheca clavata]|uniref:Histidine acid phosphatase n=1 Tax=Thraustotheca clavata TaxID=74557 RepID=A0A1W0A982_9STRA|nr:histidine acid phosphatase [Thraustotheca clavata]